MYNNGYPIQAPKIKKTPLSYILKVILYLCITFSVWFEGQNMLNMLPYIREGAMLLGQMSGKAAANLIQYVMPFILGLVFFGLYFMFSRFCYNSVYRALIVFEQQLDANYFDTCAVCCFIALAITRGAFNMLWSLYPLAYNIGVTISNIVTTVAILGILYWLLSRKIKSDFQPFLFSSIILPFIIVLIFA